MTGTLSTMEEAARWFAVLRRNVMTVDERESFEHWLAEPANRAALAQMERSWSLAGRLASGMPDGARRQAAAASSRRTVLKVAGGLAASLALGLGAKQGGLLSRWDWDGEVETGIAEQREFTLPEGSVIQLNVMSKVRWRLSGAERQVSLLSGDALFTVSKNAERPFVVQTDKGTVRVLGTVFSVSMRDDDGSVAVREGHVAFTPGSAAGKDGPDEAVQLVAGQGIRFDDRGAARVVTVPPDQVGEWTDHFVTFDQVALGDVVQELGRYFPLKVRIDPPDAATRRVTLRLKLQDQNSTLDILSQLLAARIERLSSRRIVMHLSS